MVAFGDRPEIGIGDLVLLFYPGLRVGGFRVFHPSIWIADLHPVIIIDLIDLFGIRIAVTILTRNRNYGERNYRYKPKELSVHCLPREI